MLDAKRNAMAGLDGSGSSAAIPNGTLFEGSNPLKALDEAGSRWRMPLRLRLAAGLVMGLVGGFAGGIAGAACGILLGLLAYEAKAVLNAALMALILFISLIMMEIFGG